MLINWNVPEHEKKTHTTVFILPAFMSEGGIKRLDLKGMGFVNAYIKDAEQPYEGNDYRIYLLFKVESWGRFKTLYKKFEKWLVDEYDYKDNFVVIVLKIPQEWKKDFELFIQGKYSKFSQQFRSKLPDTEILETNPPTRVNTYVWQVINKLPELKERIEDELGILVDNFPDTFREYASPPNPDNETLYIHTYAEEMIEKKK